MPNSWFGRFKPRAQCSNCGALRKLLKDAYWCIACDAHATNCQNRMHAPGKCKTGRKIKQPPVGIWAHPFKRGDIPDAEFVD